MGKLNSENIVAANCIFTCSRMAPFPESVFSVFMCLDHKHRKNMDATEKLYFSV